MPGCCLSKLAVGDDEMTTIIPQELQKKKLIAPPFTTSLPAPAWFRVGTMPADATYPVHSHPWGEFVYSYSGIMEVKIKNEHLTAPPHFGIWLPPKLTHVGLNRNEATHCSFYLMPELCEELPTFPCTLKINEFTISILEHLKDNPLTAPIDDKSMRILQVLSDQLCSAPRQSTFLPYTSDPLLSKVIAEIEKCPSVEIPLNELAEKLGYTVRTLNRRSHQLLGMSLGDWRQRLRVVKAIDLLEKGEKVEIVAYSVGYSSASSFIAMFHRVTGRTPGSIATRCR